MSSVSKTLPCGELFSKLGFMAVMTVGILGVLSLIYYGFELCPQASALNYINSQTWSEEVKSNLQKTYLYFFSSFYIWVFFSTLVFYNETMFKVFSSFVIVVVHFIIEILVQSGRAFLFCRTTGIFSLHRFLWIAYCAFLGGISSTSLLSGLNTVKVSVHITLTIVGALIIISLTAPADKFVTWEKHLHFFEMIVFAGLVGSTFLPVTTCPGTFFLSLSVYGGLILFPLYFLSHSQQAHLLASQATSASDYCSLAMSVPMLLDTISLFHRIVTIIYQNERN